MSIAAIWAFIRAIVPSKKISAWILGVVGAGIALFMGISSSDLKEQFCASAVVELPKVVIDAKTPAAMEVKK